MCDQQRLRPACAYAQSDQSLCLSLEYSMTFRLLSEQHLEFIPLKGGCRGSFESIFAKMPLCWKSHVAANLCSLIGPFVVPCPAAQWPVLLNKMPSQIILKWTIIRPQYECVPENYFSYFSTKTYVVGTRKNCLDETFLLSTQNICLN